MTINNGDDDLSHHHLTAATWVFDELEGNRKGKSPKYNIQDDGHISSGQAVHFIYRKFTLKKPELPHQVWSHGGSTLKKKGR